MSIPALGRLKTDTFINTLIFNILLVLKQLPVQGSIGYLLQAIKRKLVLNDLDRKIYLRYYMFFCLYCDMLPIMNFEERSQKSSLHFTIQISQITMYIFCSSSGDFGVK